jgi:F-type H+-transporting ATPase subunit delta
VREGNTVARRYAKALFSLAREQHRTEAVGRELGAVIEALTSSPELTEFLSRPWNGAAAKRGAAVAVVGRLDVSTPLRNLVGVLATRGRIDRLRDIGAAYRDLVDGDLGRVRAQVRTAVPLTAQERLALAARLGRALGGKQVLLEEVVDRNLLGGFIAQVGSLVLDGSLDDQLARLRERVVRG